MENNLWTKIEPQIRDTIQELDNRHQAARPKILLYGGIISAGIIFLINAFSRGFLLQGSLPFPFVLLFLAIPCAIGFGIVYAIYHNQHNKTYKAEVVPKLIDAICPGSTYSPQGTLGKEIIQAGGLHDVSLGKRYHNEDTIRGKVDKTDFVYGEVKISHIQSDGKNSREVTDFQGFVFEADFNKYFQGKTIVTSQRHALTGNAVGLFSSLSRIHLEDINFEERYKTYGTNDQEARYILSPALQQRILQMHDTFRQQLGDKELSISFHDSRMFIMVPSSTNRLEVKYDLEGVKRDFLALTLMIDIVNQLNLNLRIWTKE